MMLEKASVFKISGLPEAFGVLLLSVSFILLLTPYLSGKDFGLFKVPELGPTATSWWKRIGPGLFLLVVLAFIPLFNVKHTSEGKADTIPSNPVANVSPTSSTSLPSPSTSVSARSPDKVVPKSTIEKQEIARNPGNANTQLEKPLYSVAKELKKGGAFIDPRTQTTIGVSDVTSLREAKITLTLPNRKRQDLERVRPGTSWDFSFKGSTYRMTLTNVDWYKDSIEVQINELRK
jgi:hypothetical protein